MEVVTANQSADKVSVEIAPVEKTPVQQASDEHAIWSSSCINQENGESVTLRECPRASDPARQDETQANVDEAVVKSSESNGVTELHVSPQDTNENSSDSWDSSVVVGGHPSNEKYRVDYRQLFKIIKTAVYINDIQQIISLRSDIEVTKDDIQNAAFQNDGNLPPIPEDESNFDNPRRVRPARNHALENAANIALEVSTAYRISENGGLYKKDTVEIEKLKNQYGRLQDYLKSVRE